MKGKATTRRLRTDDTLRSRQPGRGKPQPQRRVKSKRSWAIVAALLSLVAILVAGICVRNLRNRVGHQVESSSGKTSIAALDMTASNSVASDEGPTNITAASEQLNRGTQLLEAGNVDGAITQYHQALKLNPDDEDAHYNLALAYTRKGNREGAVAEYLESLRLYPDYSEAHNNLGNLLAAQGKLDEAATHLREAVRLAPMDAVSQNSLGHVLARQRKIDEAIPCFKEAIRLSPDYAEAHLNLGSAYLVQRKIDEAIAELKTALRLKPDFEVARRVLAKAEKMRDGAPPK